MKMKSEQIIQGLKDIVDQDEQSGSGKAFKKFERKDHICQMAAEKIAELESALKLAKNRLIEARADFMELT